MFTALVPLALALVAKTSPTPGTEQPSMHLVGRAGPAKVYTGCSVKNMVALTFDDGPYIYETSISDTLTKAGIKGTFFVNGDNYDCIYDESVVQSLQHTYNAGHLIGSHTWSHPDLTTLTFDEIHDQMWKVELAMKNILGAKPAFMRPPYGNYNDLVVQVAGERNQSLVLWDFDSQDSIGATVAQSEQLYTNAIKQHPANILALNHETYETTADQVLPFAIQKLKAAGYTFGTVAECLGGLAPYHSYNTPGTRDSSWTC
ncbi:carbohydrate esterase family 4 protein [Punctularia strigosozonata HHB-11173 SS5]|uniref:carbohydrate esterase family 4 protein n=1 Tax=Punctularia strigosozonata (strain HHB-11173) TaxID=741275 RepID=UPI00044182D1|nr:carbohydrate esterase family 4 protein [Punctularia strigosozonata HHB-11173 SS5]EIN08131.1 carbohydrate esterase family 4 protein [Punctularia strigosozonata HHB-11173 SS5]